MSADGAGAGRFTPLLPLAVPLPFPGAYGAITAIYDGTAVREWNEHYAAVMAPAHAADAALLAQRATLPQPESNSDPAWLAHYATQRAQERAAALAVIAALIVRFEWPYTDAPPDPADPAAFAAWADPVLIWLAGPGLTEASEVMLGPLLKSRSGRTIAPPPGSLSPPSPGS